MTSVRIAIASLALLAIAGMAAAEEGGAFVVQLGRDTTSVERYTRTPSRIDVQQVGRAPRVLHRHFVYDYADGALTHLAVTVMAPGGTAPTQTIDATAEADSIRLVIQNGTAPPQKLAVGLHRGALVVAGSSPWSGYERLTMKLASAHADSLHSIMYFLGATGTNVVTLQKLGRDSVVLANDHLDVYHVRVDRDGRVLGVQPISGTQKFGVTRVKTLDVDAMTAAFAAREQAGAGLGILSPRDTVRVSNAGGATLWIDYGRPAMRGRVVYGGIVPYGEVWRTGANAATQFRTDKALDFGSTTIPAGFYTLWSIVTADGWKLVINSQTGQWGTEHDAAKDLYTVTMHTQALPEPAERFTIRVVPTATGGDLQFDWASTRAHAEFKAAREKSLKPVS